MIEGENFKNMDNFDIKVPKSTFFNKTVIFWISIGLVVLALIIIIIYSISTSSSIHNDEERSPQKEDKKERINNPCNIGEDEKCLTC